MSKVEQMPSEYVASVEQIPIEPTRARVETYVSNISVDHEHSVQSDLNPRATPFSPPHQVEKPDTSLPINVTSDFTRFLLKKDLLMSRLSNFNDRAEQYPTWKTSFRSVMDDLGVGPQEEIDLLVKWTGPESQRHVLSIKSANAKNPSKGLRRIWDRLNERYGAPEMINASLRQRLDSFPKIKDNKKLYELSDLVSEIEAIKEDEAYWSLLGHFDSSTGVTPIVNKLSYSLQQKCTSSAVKYCKANGVTYPPFCHFANFLREQGRTLNNPSFIYESSVPVGTTHQRKDKPQRNEVVARKTELRDSVSTKPEPTPRTESDRKPRCPIHNTRHSLNDCRGFKEMPISKRCDLLRQKRICFRCCETTDHSKPNCKEIIKCNVCSSSEHLTGLHVEGQTALPRTQNGGESSQTPVKATCTQICGDISGVGKSCAKTLLVKVYPRNKPENAALTYMTVDDQSNRTLANSSLFDQLGIESEPYPYSLSSCSGKVNTTGRRAFNLII